MDKHGEIESITIEAAENGYMVMCRCAQPKAKKGETCPYVEPERYVYETSDAALAKVGTMLAKVKKARGGGMTGMGMKD